MKHKTYSQNDDLIEEQKVGIIEFAPRRGSLDVCVKVLLPNHGRDASDSPPFGYLGELENLLIAKPTGPTIELASQ